MAVPTVPRPAAATEIAALLDSPEIAGMVGEFEALNWTGQKGYGARALVGACLVKGLYALPTWSRTARLIAEHDALKEALGAAPSQWACYRFARRLRENRPALDACFAALAASLRAANPEYGKATAIDSSDLPAYANGQRFVRKGGPLREKYSDPDASWGHRSAVSTRKGGGFYGYKLHGAVCVVTGLPLAWQVRTARDADGPQAIPLLDAMIERGFLPETCAMDKGYDSGEIHDGFEARGCHPIVAQVKIANAKSYNDVPVCQHGAWMFAGADFPRKRTKWRCPTGECQPKSIWLKADRRNPLVPRSTRRFRDLYAGRSAVEREFGRLKHEYGLGPLRVRRIERVALHADLTILARLSQALARARAVPLAA